MENVGFSKYREPGNRTNLSAFLGKEKLDIGKWKLGEHKLESESGNVGFSKDRDSAEPGTRTNLSASLGWMGGGSDPSNIQ